MNNDFRNHSDDDTRFMENQAAERDYDPQLDPSACRDLAHSFQRLNNLDNGAFERVGRYEIGVVATDCPITVRASATPKTSVN